MLTATKSSAKPPTGGDGEIQRLAHIAAELYAGLLAAAPGEQLPDEQRDIDRARELAAGLAALANSA